MSDLIDRQALLKQIDIDSDGEPGYYGDTWKFIDTIKNMPNVHDLPKDTDTISRQAAIEVIDSFNVFESRSDQIKLEQMIGELPPAQPSTGDCWGCNCPKMERLAQPAPSQVAKDIARIVGNGEDMRVIAHGRIRGRWIIRETSSGDTEARCSHCGFTTLVDEPGNGLHMVSDLNFCPNCGADMREVTT